MVLIVLIVAPLEELLGSLKLVEPFPLLLDYIIAENSIFTSIFDLKKRFFSLFNSLVIN